MELAAAQKDLRRAYAGGAPGVLVSGLVWTVTGVILAQSGVPDALIALFIGGMMIHPGAVSISRLLRAPKVTKGNRLERLGLESAFILFAGVIIGWRLLPVAELLVIPVFAMLIGVRYFVFATLYDDRIYWLLGGAIAMLGTVFVLRAGLPVNVALCVGVVELGFAVAIFARFRRGA